MIVEVIEEVEFRRFLQRDLLSLLLAGRFGREPSIDVCFRQCDAERAASVNFAILLRVMIVKPFATAFGVRKNRAAIVCRVLGDELRPANRCRHVTLNALSIDRWLYLRRKFLQSRRAFRTIGCIHRWLPRPC